MTKEITHDEAKAIASRLIWSAYRRDGQPFEQGKGMISHIQARPDLDDDIRITDYIKQQESKDSRKRYMAFGYDDYYYYPGSGMQDWYGSFDTVEEALRQGAATYSGSQHVEIFDFEARDVTAFKKVDGDRSDEVVYVLVEDD
jgi:hypothetical protein